MLSQETDFQMDFHCLPTSKLLGTLHIALLHYILQSAQPSHCSDRKHKRKGEGAEVGVCL